MKTVTIALGAALLATSGAAAAQSATDARCIVVSNAFAQNSKDADQQKLAQASLYFYLGRLSSRATAAQLKSQVDAEAKTMTEAKAGPLMTSCANTFATLLDTLSPPQQQPGQQPPKK